MRCQPKIPRHALVGLCLCLALWSFFAQAADPPGSVNQLIVAMDGWGSDLIDPWEFAQPGVIQDYINLRLITRDENMQVQPLWAVEWSQNAQGFDIKLNP